ANLGGLRIDRRRDAKLAVAIYQQVMHLQQQRRGGSQTELTGHWRTVRSTDPDADQMTRTDANGPGVAKAVAGTGLPGQRGPLRQLRARVTVRPRLAAENAPDDPRRTG